MGNENDSASARGEVDISEKSEIRETEYKRSDDNGRLKSVLELKYQKTDNNNNAYIPPHLRRKLDATKQNDGNKEIIPNYVPPHLRKPTTKQIDEKDTKYVPPHLRKKFSDEVKQNEEKKPEKRCDINPHIKEQQSEENTKNVYVPPHLRKSYTPQRGTDKRNVITDPKLKSIKYQNENKKDDMNNFPRNSLDRSAKTENDNNRENKKPNCFMENLRQTYRVGMKVPIRPNLNLNFNELKKLLEKYKENPEKLILSFEECKNDLDDYINANEMDIELVLKLTVVLNQAFECDSIQTIARNKIEKIVESNYFKQHLYNAILIDPNNLELIKATINLCLRFLILHPICRVKLGPMKDRLELLVREQKLKDLLQNLINLDEEINKR